jgi:hypothetical protein
MLNDCVSWNRRKEVKGKQCPNRESLKRKIWVEKRIAVNLYMLEGVRLVYHHALVHG